MGAIKDITGMVKSKVTRMNADNALHSKLMSNFPESVVGLKNMATISKKIMGNIKSNRVNKAMEYAKSQTMKINAQKSRKRYSRIPE